MDVRAIKLESFANLDRGWALVRPSWKKKRKERQTSQPVDFYTKNSIWGTNSVNRTIFPNSFYLVFELQILGIVWEMRVFRIQLFMDVDIMKLVHFTCRHTELGTHDILRTSRYRILQRADEKQSFEYKDVTQPFQRYCYLINRTVNMRRPYNASKSDKVRGM